MALTPATNKQVPEHSILDHFDKQTYLGNAFIVPTTAIYTYLMTLSDFSGASNLGGN